MSKKSIKLKQKVKDTKIRKVIPNHLNRFDIKHQGQRGFVIGGGPSILDIKDKGFDFNLLKDEITVGVNKAYSLIIPTYLVWTDPYFWKTFKKELISLKCIKFCPANIVKKFSIENNNIYSLRRDKDQKGATIGSSLSNPIPMWNNSGVTGLRIAHVLGLNPIYLVGIDLLLEDTNKRTHFHEFYDKTRIKKTTKKRYNLFFESFQKTINSLKEKNIEVISCSKTSKLNDIISFIPINTLF